MITLLFMICLFYVFGKLFIVGVKAAWGITKLFFVIIFWPVILIGLVLVGLIYVAIPILAIIGLVTVCSRGRY